MATDGMAIDFGREARQVHRFSLDQYHRIIERGGFDDDFRAELIEGVLVDMSIKTREHENAIRWLTRWLVLAVDSSQYEVGVQTSLTLVESESEPEPDFTVLSRDAPRPYHPSTAVLVIEVTVSSHCRDLRQKPFLYARAGVPEYWVADIENGRLVVHRNPEDDSYQSIVAVPGDGRVEAQALQLPPLNVADLLTAARQ
ncbi:MAG TPA: Uma2 family endonuclease [Solirubrobacteraceae bacterium]|nr:Uma2 family endonuclease [Solirubrobacteraceae bacterium]